MPSILSRFLPILLLAVAVVAVHGGMPNVAAAGTSTADVPRVALKDLKVGEGEEVVRHSTVKVHYTGWLMDGTKFDSSLDRGEPFGFVLGAGRVIQGWDIGVVGMKRGGVRELIISAELAYGERGAGGVIPPNATLRFEIELLDFVPPDYSNIGNDVLQVLIDRGVRVVDIRRADEWAETGTIAGVERLTAFDEKGRLVRDFAENFMAMAPVNEEVVLICRVGNRSAVLANMLVKQAGYTKVYNVEDGIVAWIDGGHPVEK